MYLVIAFKGQSRDNVAAYGSYEDAVAACDTLDRDFPDEIHAIDTEDPDGECPECSGVGHVIHEAWVRWEQRRLFCRNEKKCSVADSDLFAGPKPDVPQWVPCPWCK